MQDFAGPYSGSSTDMGSARWRKSRHSNQGGNCVELAVLPEGSGIAVRNSRNPERTG